MSRRLKRGFQSIPASGDVLHQTPATARVPEALEGTAVALRPGAGGQKRPGDGGVSRRAAQRVCRTGLAG